MLKHSLFLLLLVGFIGCNRPTVQVVQTVNAPSGKDRLVRKDWVTVSRSNPNEKSYDSHSIVWQQFKNGDWQNNLTISQADFQSGCPNRRWIDSIHSFDAKSGEAIIRIAEGNAPEGSTSISYIYSWRKWDIKKNRELEFIRVSESPFEKYD